jgi:hypothetical protein
MTSSEKRGEGEFLRFFRKTLNSSEVYDLAEKAAIAAMAGCRMANEKTLMETADAAQEIAFRKIMFRQVKNQADKRGDNRDDLYTAAYAAAWDLVEYRVANETGAIRLGNIINSAKELFGENVSEEANIAAYEAFTESAKNERKNIPMALAVTEISMPQSSPPTESSRNRKNTDTRNGPQRVVLAVESRTNSRRRGFLLSTTNRW